MREGSTRARAYTPEPLAPWYSSHPSFYCTCTLTLGLRAGFAHAPVRNFSSESGNHSHWPTAKNSTTEVRLLRPDCADGTVGQAEKHADPTKVPCRNGTHNRQRAAFVRVSTVSYLFVSLADTIAHTRKITRTQVRSFILHTESP